MKKISLFFLSILIFTACGKHKNPDGMKEIATVDQLNEYYDSPTQADSMMVYFGQMQAYNYWQDAETDTLLRTDQAREDFMKGFREGLKMESDNDAYNKGLQLALRLAIRLREFQGRYEAEFPEEIMAAALQYYLKNKDSINIVDAQAGFYKGKDAYELNSAKKELSKATKKLKEEARLTGYTFVSDSLYYKDITPSGSGPRFKDGDRIAIEITASTFDGSEIVGRQFPDSITIGEGRIPRIIALSLHTMTDGQTRAFMTTPRTLFGKRYRTYNIPDDEPVIMTIKASAE